MSKFDEIFDRKNSNSFKWDYLEEKFGNNDVLPLWVADMDFKSPKIVSETLEKISSNGFFGYTFKGDEFYNSIVNWIEKRHGWKIDKNNIFTTHGVVNGLSAAINAFSDEGDKIIIQTPVYHPFYKVIETNKREIIKSPLKLKDDKYEMDFDNLNEIIDEKTKILILCNPHNPVGRVWTEQELKKLSDLIIEKDIILLSDEIHSDLIFKPNKHTPIAKLSKEISEKTITFMAPSKTFNLPGLETSYAIIENENYVDKFKEVLNSWSISGNNIYGIFGTQTAYNQGENWLEEILDYIHGNYIYLKDFFSSKIPEIKTYPLEGTYLMWINCKGLNMTNDELDNFFIEKVKVGLNPGYIFGKEGEGFQRINIACPKKYLEYFANNFYKALQK
jgi:cystathionine beta-lyase